MGPKWEPIWEPSGSTNHVGSSQFGSNLKLRWFKHAPSKVALRATGRLDRELRFWAVVLSALLVVWFGAGSALQAVWLAAVWLAAAAAASMVLRDMRLQQQLLVDVPVLPLRHQARGWQG